MDTLNIPGVKTIGGGELAKRTKAVKRRNFLFYLPFLGFLKKLKVVENPTPKPMKFYTMSEWQRRQLERDAWANYIQKLVIRDDGFWTLTVEDDLSLADRLLYDKAKEN